MSIVERAIKKLQKSYQQQQRTRAAAETVSAQPVATGTGKQTAETLAVAVRPIAIPVRRSIQLDLESLRSHRLLPPVDQEREIASQYRQIKRPLIASGIGRGADRFRLGNAVMVTSSVPGEGKSFTSLNLALSMALERQLSVVLVDADVGRSRLSNEFGLQNDPGLLDALENRSTDPESLLIGTDLPTLKILPSGKPSSTATELLASPRMEEVVLRLCAGDDERIIVFDSPPVLPTTEARAFAQYMGQIVFLVHAGSTPQQAVLEALHLIGERAHVGLVLTQTRGPGAGAYYYTSYDYGSYEEPIQPEAS